MTFHSRIQHGKACPPEPLGRRRSSTAFTLVELLACPSKPLGRRRSSTAFTLVELLVVIAIVAVLIALMVPALTRARQMARDLQCRSQLRTVQLAAKMHASDHNQRMLLCRRWSSNYPPSPHPIQGNCITWRPELNMASQVQLGPYLFEQQPGGGRPSVLTCPVVRSWGGRIHDARGNTYAINGYATVWFGQHQQTDPIMASWYNITRPSEVMLFMDGNMGFFRHPSTGLLYWVVNPEIVPSNMLTNQAMYGFTAYRHAEHSNIAYMDGHVAPVSLEYARTVLNVERDRHPFWGAPATRRRR